MRPDAEPAETDRGLLMAIAKGQQDAFDTLYRKYETRLFHYVLNLIRDANAAEDVLAEAMLAIWHGAKSFRGEAQVSTWMFGIARHKALDASRQQQRDGRRTTPLDDALQIEDPQDGPVEHAMQQATAAYILKALSQLSDDHREVLHLAFYEDLSYQEIAELVGIPVNTVKTRVFYAKKALKEILVKQEAREPIR
jgi:RNA polymerase sigma-70 factor (ECF subfamily)